MTTEQLPQRAAQLIAEIPDDERAVFEQYYANRLAEAQRTANAQISSRALGSADPDQVERDLVDALIRESEGRDDPDGLGLVPTAEHENYIVPPDSDPRFAATRRRSGKATDSAASELGRGKMALGIGLILLPVLWFAWSAISMTQRGAAPAAAAAAVNTPSIPPTALAFSDMPIADEKSIAGWYPASLELQSADGQGSSVYRTVASPNTLGSNWAPSLADGVAAWLPNTYINSIFCLPPSAQLQLTTARAGQVVRMRTVSGSVRDYVLLRVRSVARQQVEILDQQHAGLTLIVCGTEGEQRTVAEAQFRPAFPTATMGSIGQEQRTSALHALVTQARVTTTAQYAAALDLTTVLTNTGQVSLTSTDVAAQFEVDGSVAEVLAAPKQFALAVGAGATVTTRYAVPASGGTGTWRLTMSDGTTLAVRVPFPAQAPPVLQQATLHSGDVFRQQLGGTTVVSLTLTVTAAGTTPLLLTPNDVAVQVDTQPVVLRSESTSLPLRVAPGTSARLTLVVNAPTRTPIVVQVGPQRWQLTIPLRAEGG